MKKLVAISVLLASLTAAVFAQDEGKWKVGFMAEFVTDMLYATDMSGKSEVSGGGLTQEFGAFNKGTINFFQNRNAFTNFDNRLSVSLSNSGENYDVWADIALDGWADQFATESMTIGKFLSEGKAKTDWYAKGTAGIFNAQIGTAGYGGYVSPQSTWNNWYGKWNQICKFGLWRQDGFIVGDDFRTQDEWGEILALGIGLGDNFKVSLGYRLRPQWKLWTKDADPAASKSSINGSFMVNGRVTDAIAFDLFYSVVGEDPNTFSRPTDTWNGTGVTLPDGSWNNILGAYIGLNIVENLGLSLGYTANFRAYENGGYIPAADAGNPTKSKPVSFTTPFYSGIDIRASYSGIDKIGLTLNNNITFAGVKGKEIKTDGTTEEYVLDFGYSPIGDKESTDWFHLESELKASLALVDNLSLVVQLGDRLGVMSSENTTSGNTSKVKATENEFRFTVGASYGVGAVTIGAGLFFSIESKAFEREENSGTAVTTKASSDVTTFGIPVYFKVAF